MTNALPFAAASAPSAHVVAFLKQFARSVKPLPSAAEDNDGQLSYTFVFDLAKNAAQA